MAPSAHGSDREGRKGKRPARRAGTALKDLCFLILALVELPQPDLNIANFHPCSICAGSRAYVRPPAEFPRRNQASPQLNSVISSSPHVLHLMKISRCVVSTFKANGLRRTFLAWYKSGQLEPMGASSALIVARVTPFKLIGCLRVRVVRQLASNARRLWPVGAVPQSPVSH